MRCQGCTRTIPPHRQARAHIERSDDGRIIAAWHDRCWANEERRRKTSGPLPGGRYHPDAPSVEEATRTNRDDKAPAEQARRDVAESEYRALRQRQHQLAEARDQEETPRRFDDWRDPAEMDLDELVAETERIAEALGTPVPSQSEEES